MSKSILIDYAASGLGDCAEFKKLDSVRNLLSAARGAQGYDSPFSFVKISGDTAYHDLVASCAHEKRLLACSSIVVIGIGGSSLSAKAVHEALHSVYWNETNKPCVYFADTLDPYETLCIKNLVACDLKDAKSVLLVLISKTGTTLESVAHFAVFLSLLKNYYPVDYRKYVVIISDEQSVLAGHARKMEYSFLPIPTAIGGRYSVFTAVGLFVLAACGVDIKQLCSGADLAVKNALENTYKQNDAMMSALCIYQQYQRGNKILDYFMFLKTCMGIGAWYRQLVGESLGKVRVDKTACQLVPTVSVGSNDLHAVAQLYLGGLPPVFTQFLTCDYCQSDIPVSFGEFGPDLSRFSYGSLMRVLFQATKSAYDEQKRPYLHIQLPELTAFYVGQLLQFHMLQVVYLGTLFDVNPFDQPQVELYKKYVRQLIN